MKNLVLCLFIFLTNVRTIQAQQTECAPDELKLPEVYLISIEGQINSAQIYNILHRALKQAIAEKIEIVVLKIETIGGKLKTTLEMMEILDNFNGNNFSFYRY